MARQLGLGESARFFNAPAIGGNPRFSFDTAAGRYLLLLFFGSAGREETATALAAVERHAATFDDRKAAFFGITCDPEDEAQGRIAQRLPGRRFFFDYDGRISRGYGALDEEGHYKPYWLLLDIDMRVIGAAPLDKGEELIELIQRLPHPDAIDRPAPVLTASGIFEPEFCRRLIAYYEEHGGEDSGFMRDVDGKTVGIVDHSFKRRDDCQIVDPDLRVELRNRIESRLVPQIRKAFQFNATRLERYLVARYDGGSGGYFKAHRDNTTLGTAHRRFACTINLNAEEFEGGELRFPEYGRRTYRASTGGAVVFSCSLLHEAQPVTRGVRFCFLPFLYDDAGDAIRKANEAKVIDAARDSAPQAGG